MWASSLDLARDVVDADRDWIEALVPEA